MVLKNITIKTADLGSVSWENVEKLQPGENGFICFFEANEQIKQDENGENITSLVGSYIETGFKKKPNYKEVINVIISTEYPNGKEQQMLRQGVKNPLDKEYLEYFNNVEDIRATFKNLLS